MPRQTHGNSAGRSALPALGVVTAFIVIAALLPRFFNNSRTQVYWRLSPDWHVRMWSARQVECVDNDVPPGQPVPPIMQVFQVQGSQFGPISLMTHRWVPPRPGEVKD